MPLADTAFAIGCFGITMSPLWDVIAASTFSTHALIGLLVLWTATMILPPILTFLHMVFHGIVLVFFVPVILYHAMMDVSVVLLHAITYAASALLTKRALWIEGSCIAVILGYRYAVGWLNKIVRDHKLERERKEWLLKIEIDDYQYAWGINSSIETAQYEADRVQWNNHFDREPKEEPTDIHTVFAQSLSAQQELARLQVEAEHLHQALIDIAISESREEDRVVRAVSYADAIQNITPVISTKSSRQAGVPLSSPLRMAKIPSSHFTVILDLS